MGGEERRPGREERELVKGRGLIRQKREVGWGGEKKKTAKGTSRRGGTKSGRQTDPSRFWWALGSHVLSDALKAETSLYLPPFWSIYQPVNDHFPANSADFWCLAGTWSFGLQQVRTVPDGPGAAELRWGFVLALAPCRLSSVCGNSLRRRLGS